MDSHGSDMFVEMMIMLITMAIVSSDNKCNVRINGDYYHDGDDENGDVDDYSNDIGALVLGKSNYFDLLNYCL